MATPKHLFLLRHAKSTWDDPRLEDHERPLAPRGRRAVQQLGAYLRRERISPDQVLCSTSRRTRETLAGIELDPDKQVMIERGLYEASASSLLERLQQVPDEVESVLVVGHNPTMQTLVLRLARDGDSAGRGLAEVRQKFPTGAFAALSFEGSWSELGPGKAQLDSLVRPHDLH